jgi:hypothetical protein
MVLSAVNHNNQPPDSTPAAPSMHAAQSHGQNNNEAVAHLNRQPAQIGIQIVDEMNAIQSEGLPEDVLQLGEVVDQPDGHTIF